MQNLYQALGITGLGGTRKRATAMLIAGGLFKSSDEKIPYLPYKCTMHDDESSLIKVENQPIPPYKNDFIQPARGTVGVKPVTLIPDALTFLSCATWGLTLSETSRLYPSSKDPVKAHGRVKRVLEWALDLLDARDAPQAIAHAHAWGALKIDPRVLDPELNEPPEPLVFKNAEIILPEKFAHRLPSART